MNNPVSAFASSSTASPARSRPPVSSFAPRFAPAVAVRSRFSAAPRYRLIDPNLLDRLQSPLTRYHD